MNETTEEIVLENYFNSSSFDTKSNGTVHSAISDFTAIVFAIGLSILAIVLHVKKEKFLESRNARYEEQRRIQQEEEDLKKKRACPETRKQAFSKLIETKVSCVTLLSSTLLKWQTCESHLCLGLQIRP